MSEQMMTTVPTQRVVDGVLTDRAFLTGDVFTEPNAFLSETAHLPTTAGVLPGQRTINEVPAQREHGQR